MIVNEEAVKKILEEVKPAKLVAATKYVDVKEIEKLEKLGVTCFGENRVQAFLEKYENYHGNGEFQFIGTLQPNTEKINISIQVIGMGNTMMSGTLNVDKNSNALSVLKTLAAKNGKEVAGSDYYVSGIGGLYEKQHGPMSGWMYSVNGVAPNKAAIKYDLNDGDQVVWYYVNYN